LTAIDNVIQSQPLIDIFCHEVAEYRCVTTFHALTEYIWAKPKDVAQMTSLPAPVKVFTDTPYGAQMVIHARIESILHRRELKKKSSEAILCLSWDGEKDISWETESGNPPEAALAAAGVKSKAGKPTKKKK